MSPVDDPLGDSDRSRSYTSSDARASDDRLAALEQRVAALSDEIAVLRETSSSGTQGAQSASTPVAASAFVSAAVAAGLRQPPTGTGGSPPPPRRRESFSDRLHSAATIRGDELESLVGRYGTLALAALVILMAVGAVIKMAVQHGLLTPEVRVVAGVIVAVLLATAGFIFRRRGAVRYGGVLLALSLAVIDLVAWGAGPRFHLVPTSVALVAVDVVAVTLAALALHDESEFLFVVAVAGALSSPFVTTNGGGTALALLLYGGFVLAGALRAARDPEWARAVAVLVIGALVYALAAAALPISAEWYGPYLVVLFGGACAAAALLFGAPEWRSELPRAYLAITGVGVLAGWDAVGGRPFTVTLGVALGLAGVTYAALRVRHEKLRLFTASALVLPLVSLGVAYAGAATTRVQGAVCALWTVFALAAWRVERGSADDERAGAHLLAATILGCSAVTAWFWDMPLPFVAGLALWGVIVAGLCRNELSVLPSMGVALATGAAALFSIDQLISRSAYSYTPFVTRSSASALCAALGIGIAGALIGRGNGGAATFADRPVRLGVLIGFLIVWGRMEMAQAFNHDLASFLLTSYYAACGVGSIVAGRQLGIGRVRVAGLALALYAAFKALVEVTDIGSLLLRVGAYAAVGMFLLGAGYLYREEQVAGDLG